MLPDGFYDLSQFGKGQYRIDGKMSVGHFNNIYIIFQANGVRDAEIVSGATESTFMVKDRKVMWRSYKTVVEGRAVIRKEAVMPNILPREKPGNSSDYIWIRMEADSQQILDQLTPAAEEILRDCAEGKPKQLSVAARAGRAESTAPVARALANGTVGW